MANPLRTIAIADDERGMRDVLQLTLTDLGYECVGTASNGREAVELVKARSPQIILMDIHMPEVDGLEATKQIAALGTTAVLILTADVNPDLARKAMDLGACGYMQKPFETAQLGAFVETAWHRFHTVSALQDKTRELSEALELRKSVEKAKGILMQQQGFSEQDAHRMLQKMSQDQGISMKEVCRSVIQVQSVLGLSRSALTRQNRPK